MSATAGSSMFERLLSPIQVGPMRVPNRMCETTNTIGAGRAEGVPDDVFLAHHLAKARGGIGWIGNGTWPLNVPVPDEATDEFVEGGAAMRFPLYYLPGFVEKVAWFCDAIHKTGAVVVFQITQLNAMFGPSSVPINDAYDWIPHEMDDDEIDFVIGTFAAAAAEIKKGGVDAIEIHAAHETMPQLFLSPATNRRTDRWGGDTEARTRFLTEIILRVREEVGDSLAIGFRMSSQEIRPGGYGALEAQEIAGRIVEAARPDYISVDIGHGWGDPSYVAPSLKPMALGADGAKSIRQVVAPVPVLYSGRVFDPHVAEDLIAKGACDLVGVTRASIADPEFGIKVREGRLEEIRSCIGDNRCIDNAVQGPGTGLGTVGQRAMCSVNPVIGNELYWETNFRPAMTKRRVVIVGGGPAGLETARVAAMRGQEVILLERRPALGGQMLLSSVAPGREQFANFISYQETQMKLLGVDVRLGVDATPEAVRALAPDVLVCATGSTPAVPDIAGLDNANVVQGRDVLARTVDVGGSVAIISLEDGMETPSIADFLATKGHAVEIFHHWNGVASHVGRYASASVLRRLEEREVKMHSHARVLAIRDGSLEVESALSARRRVANGFDAIVLSCGSVPDTTLHKALKGQVSRMYLIGSAWIPRGLHEATEHGMKVGLEV